MESVLPSEIARLVYGYLEAEGCGEAARNFLETSPHLEECLKVAQEGRRFSTRIQGRTLIQTLDLFFNINSLIQERVDKLNNTSGNNTSLSLGTANNNSLIEQLIGLLDGTNTSVINRSSSNNTNTVLLSITVPSQDDASIRVRQHSSGKHRLSVDGDLPKSKEKTVQHSSNVETQKSKKDDNVEDEPVIDLSCGEELLTRLLDNTQLHEKIAENINKAICTPEKTSPDNGKDVIQTILKQTEADPLFEQLIKELVGPAEEDSTTPEDTEFEDGHLRNGSVEPENEDESSNIKQRLRSAKSKANSGYDNKSARDVLEEQNASAVQSILDSSHTKHRKQDSNSEQVNTDRSESDKENENNQMNTTGSETNCSNLLQTAMMNCDINSSPLGTNGERSKTKVDGQLKSSGDHQPPMDLCFIDVGQLSPQNSHHHHLEPSLQEKASSMLLIQSDNLPTTSAESGTSGSQIIIPPSLCPNVLAVQPGYANVLTVLAPSAAGAAPAVVTSTPAIQNRSIPTVLLYEDFLRIQTAHSPIGTPTLLQTPTSVKQYKPIAPKPTATSESTTVPACLSSVTTSTSIGITSETAVETNEPKSLNTTAMPIVCSAVNDAQTPPTVAPVRSGRGWRREWKGVLKKKILRRSPKFKKILPKRPPVRNFLNVREQRLVNGVEVKVLDYDATGEETLPNVETEEPAETEGPKIEVISETKIQLEMDITDNANNEVNVGDIEASKDTSSEKPCVNSEELTASDTNKNSNDTPELPLSKKGLSLSTPRRKYSHVRALDFNTPPKGIIKRSNTSPKAAHRWSPRKNFMRNAKRSALFRSPTSNKTRKKFGSGEITKQQNLSVVSESEEHMSVCVKEDIHMPANGTPRKEVLPNDRSLLPPVATMSPATKLCGDWGKVNGVELILCSTNKETANKSWDADLRALAGGQFQDPSPPPKKCLSLKKDSETALNKTVSPKNKNVRSKSNHENRVANKEDSMNEKSVGEKKVVDSRVTVTKTKNHNKNTKKGKAKAQPARKKNIKGKSKEKDAQEKTYLSKEFISDTESSDLNESKRELPSKINEQNNDNEKEKSISSESGVLMVDDSQENLNKSSLSETEIARQLEENIRQIVGDELSSERTEQNSAISAEDIRQVLESSKEFGETDKKNNEENEVVSNVDNDKDNRKASNDTTDQNNITPTDIVSNEKSSSKSLLQNLPSVGVLPVLETPVKLDFVGVVPKTPNLDTPMLKIIRENTSVLSADLLLTPFAQTPLQSSSAVADQTPFKDISPNCNVSSGTSNLEQELIKECCRMEEEIAMKKSVEIKDKIVDHNEKALNSDENLNKSQRTSVEDKKLMNETSSVEISKIVSVDNSDKMVSAVNTSKEDSVENKIDPGQKHVTSSENKSETCCKGNKNSGNNSSETQNTPESNIETRVEEPFDFPRNSKYHVKLDKSKVKTTRTQNKGKCNGKNKIGSCEKSVINMKIDSTESIRQKLVREARQEIYGESSISSSDFSISELKKHKRQRRSKVYPIIYTDESSGDIPCSKTFPSRRRSNRKTKKSNISVSGSSDRSDIESINAEREHQCTSGILSTVASTPVKIDSHEQSRVYKAGDQSASPKDISKEDGLSALHSGQYKTSCKEKSDRCTKADVKLLEQPKVILTPLKRTQTRQAEKPKDEEKNIKSTISDSAEVGISFKTIPHIPDSIKALAESSQSPKKIINTLESSHASNKINTDAVEVEKQPDVVNTETDLEKQNENSSDFPPLHLSPEREDGDDCHSEVMLNIVEEDAVLSPAKKMSVLENDLELSSTVPEKRNFPINFLSETEEYHLTEITFNESNNDDTDNKMRDIGCRIVKHESYEEVYFDESKYVPKPKKVNNIDNFQMKIFLDEDEYGIQRRYCKLSVQPLQNLFEMRPIKVTEASQADNNLHEKKCPSSDSKIAGKKVDGNVSEKHLEKSAHINTPHAQYKYSKDLKHSGRSPSSTKSEYSINRSKLSEPYRNWRASSTKAMLVTRTSDGRKRIAPVRLDDYDYERRQRRRYDNSERRKSYDRQKERDRDKDVDRDRESERYRDRESERYRDQDREFDRESEKYRDRECERHRDRDFERYRDRDRELDRDRDRENEKHRGRDRELDRDCYKESEKYRDGARDIDRQRDSDRVRHREVDRDRYRERSRERGRSKEIDKDRDEDGEVRSRQSGDHARDRSCERRKSDRESESDNRTRELSEGRCPKHSEEFQKRELITYDDVYPHKSSDAEEGQCTDDDDDDDLMNQVIISKTLSPRKKGNKTTAHSTVGTPSKLPPKKRKASDDISVGPIKIARTEEPQALLKKVDLEKFLTAVHGDEASTAGTST